MNSNDFGKTLIERLEAAAVDGKESEIKELLDASPTLDRAMAIAAAIKAKQPGTVKILLEGAFDTLGPARVFVAAAYIGDAKLVDNLVREAPDYLDYTQGIIYSCRAGHIDIAHRLLNKAKPEDLEYALLLEIFADIGNANLVDRILKEAPKPFDHTPALIVAAQANRNDLVKSLLEGVPEAFDYAPVIEAAARGGHISMTQLLLTKAPGNVDCTKALNAAALAGHADIATLLLEDASNTVDLMQALRISALAGKANIVNLILNAGLDTLDYAEALSAVVPLGDVNVIKRVLDDPSDSFDLTPAVNVAARLNNLEIVKQLRDYAPSTLYRAQALEIAARSGHIDVIEALLDGALPTLDRTQALNSSVLAGHIDIVKRLLEGAPSTLNRSSALNNAILGRRVDIVKELLHQAPPSLDRSRALKSAAFIGRKDLVKALLDGAPKSLDLSDALSNAELANHVEVVALLKEAMGPRAKQQLIWDALSDSGIEMPDDLSDDEPENEPKAFDHLSALTSAIKENDTTRVNELLTNESELDSERLIGIATEKKEPLLALIGLNVTWAKKHIDVLIEGRKNSSDLEGLLFYAQMVPDINDIDEKRLQEILKDEIHVKERLLRFIDEASENFSSSVNPYFKQALFDYCLGPSKALSKRLLSEQYGASRSIIDPEKEISTYLGEMFEVIQKKRPYLKFGVEVEKGLPGLLQKIDAKISEDLNKRLHTDYDYVEDGTVKTPGLASAIEQVGSILRSREDLEKAQRSWSVLNDWGAFLNDTTGVHIHVGIDHLVPEHCLKDDESAAEGWDAKLDEDDPKSLTEFRLLFLKQLLVNMSSVEEIFFRVASDTFSKPNSTANKSGNLNEFYEDISGTEDLGELRNVVQPDGRDYNVNLDVNKHGTAEFRCFATKYSPHMGVDPNITARGVIFMQQLMDITLTQVGKTLSSGLSPAEAHELPLHPSDGMTEIAEDFVDDVFRFQITHALNDRGSDKRKSLMDALMNDKNYINDDIFEELRAIQKYFPKNDLMGQRFCEALTGNGQWESAAIPKQKQIRRQLSQRNLGDKGMLAKMGVLGLANALESESKARGHQFTIEELQRIKASPLESLAVKVASQFQNYVQRDAIKSYLQQLPIQQVERLHEQTANETGTFDNTFRTQLVAHLNSKTPETVLTPTAITLVATLKSSQREGLEKKIVAEHLDSLSPIGKVAFLKKLPNQRPYTALEEIFNVKRTKGTQPIAPRHADEWRRHYLNERYSTIKSQIKNHTGLSENLLDQNFKTILNAAASGNRRELLLCADGEFLDKMKDKLQIGQASHVSHDKSTGGRVKRK
ncbi:MAG: ankyrin repeat domain-containing protein [Pseudomonadota bacterium]